MAKSQPKNPTCSRCNGNGWLVEPVGNWARAKSCSCVNLCQKCAGSTWLISTNELGQETATRCQCAIVLQAVERYNQALVPAKYADACLDSRFKDKDNLEAFSTLKLLVEEYHAKHKGILLMGPAGVGKTWLVIAFIHELIVQRGLTVIFRDFFHLLSELKAGYSQGISDAMLIQPLVEAEVLVIDELGKGRNTPWEQNILDTLISQRYNASRMCIFTSNYATRRGLTITERLRPAGTLAEAEPIEVKETLSERVGSRVYSRLREMCDFVQMNGIDRRNLPQHL